MNAGLPPGDTRDGPTPDQAPRHAAKKVPVSARKPVRPTAVGPLGDDLVRVAKGRFQAFVDDARLLGRDWGLRLTDVKASVLADQRMRAPRRLAHTRD